MTPADFLTNIIQPGLQFLHELGGPPVVLDAQRFMLCIALTESGPQLNARYQGSPAVTPGPARGWWQFEQGGGVVGVLNHNSCKTLAANVCTACSVVAQPGAVWRAIEGYDDLAAAFARMLIMTTPKPLPTDADGGYLQYLELWRPGKPCSSATWNTNWDTANDAVSQAVDYNADA